MRILAPDPKLPVQRCVLDADVLIGWLERTDAHHAAAVELLESLAAESVELSISAINYAEVLVRPSGEPASLMRAIDAIRAIGVKPLTLDGVAAVVAASTRADGIGLADSCAITAALEERAALATFDRRVRQAAVEHGVTVVLPVRVD